MLFSQYILDIPLLRQFQRLTCLLRIQIRHRVTHIRDIEIQSLKIDIFQISMYYVCFGLQLNGDQNKRMCHICEYKMSTLHCAGLYGDLNSWFGWIWSSSNV